MGDIGHRSRGRAVGPEHRTAFEQCQIVLRTRGVASDRGEQPRQQGGSHEWLGIGQRVGQLHQCAARIVRAQPELVEFLGADEWQRDEFGESGLRERGEYRTTRTLFEAQPPSRGSTRHLGGDQLEAEFASDLFDVVVGIHQVAAPGRRHQVEPAIGLLGDLDARCPQHVDHLLRTDLRSQDPGRQVGPDPLSGHHRDLTGQGVIVGQLPATQFGHQPGRCPCRGKRQRGIDAPGEADRRFRRQLVTAERASDAGGIEMSRLQHDVAGRRRELGGPAAHDAGQADRPGIIGDQQILGRQCPVDIVESHQMLTVDRLTHHDGALECVRVVGVQRLPGFEHHVVRDVDVEADRTHARRSQPV